MCIISMGHIFGRNLKFQVPIPQIAQSIPFYVLFMSEDCYFFVQHTSITKPRMILVNSFNN
jgi:hypothetical protein